MNCKRWLCASDPAYHDRLSDASKRTLVLQGGPMSPAEMAAWDTRPWTADAVRLRRWDDEAKVAGRPAIKLTLSKQASRFASRASVAGERAAG